MAVRHLTDTEIQNYLDGSISRENHWTSIHLENCDDCKEQLTKYQSLFVGLNQEINFSLPRIFSNNVITKIQCETKHAFKINIWAMVLSILGLLIGMGTTLYFTSVQPFISFWNNLIKTTNFINLEWVSKISNFLSGLNLNLSILGFAVLIVLVISTIDHFIMRSKNKLASLFR